MKISIMWLNDVMYTSQKQLYGFHHLLSRNGTRHKVRFQCNCYGQWNKYRKIKISNFASSAEALIYCESIIIYAFRIDYVTKNVNQSNKIQIWHICIVRMRKCYQVIEKYNFFDLMLKIGKLSNDRPIYLQMQCKYLHFRHHSDKSSRVIVHWKGSRWNFVSVYIWQFVSLNMTGKISI